MTSLDHGSESFYSGMRSASFIKKPREQSMNIWVVKARKEVKGRSQGWHWGEHFDADWRSYSWGGKDWIQATYSKQLLRDEVAQDDIIMAYQVDDDTYGRAILGFTRMASCGKEEEPGLGFNMFDIAASEDGFRLEPPLTIAELYAAGCHPKCFGRGTQGTIFPVDQSDFDSIVSAIIAHSPHQHNALLDWLHDAGYKKRDANPSASNSRWTGRSWRSKMQARRCRCYLGQTRKKVC